MFTINFIIIYLIKYVQGLWPVFISFEERAAEVPAMRGRPIWAPPIGRQTTGRRAIWAYEKKTMKQAIP